MWATTQNMLEPTRNYLCSHGIVQENASMSCRALFAHSKPKRHTQSLVHRAATAPHSPETRVNLTCWPPMLATTLCQIMRGRTTRTSSRNSDDSYASDVQSNTHALQFRSKLVYSPNRIHDRIRCVSHLVPVCHASNNETTQGDVGTCRS